MADLTRNLTLDTGVLIKFAEVAGRKVPNSKAWALMNAIAEDEEVVVTVPSVVVAEWWRVPRGPAATILDGYDVEDFDDDLARKVGRLLAKVTKSSRAERERLLLVDATVVVSAASRGDIVHTVDGTDIERLAALGEYDLDIEYL